MNNKITFVGVALLVNGVSDPILTLPCNIQAYPDRLFARLLPHGVI